MCLFFACDEEQEVLGAQPMAGACPVCGGPITGLDVRSSWRFCFIPVCFRTHRSITCSRKLYLGTVGGMKLPILLVLIISIMSFCM